MTRTLLLAVGILLTTLAATAQTTPPFAPLDVSAPEQIGAFGVGPVVLAKSGTKEGKAAWMVVAWRTPTGQIEYTVDVTTVMLSGDVELFTAMTAAEIFDGVSERTIAAGMANGTATCSASASPSGVTLQSCVTRTGSGFGASSGNLNRRSYSCTCSATMLASVSGTFACGTGAEATWVSGWSIQ